MLTYIFIYFYLFFRIKEDTVKILGGQPTARRAAATAATVAAAAAEPATTPMAVLRKDGLEPRGPEDIQAMDISMDAPAAVIEDWWHHPNMHGLPARIATFQGVHLTHWPTSRQLANAAYFLDHRQAVRCFRCAVDVTAYLRHDTDPSTLIIYHDQKCQGRPLRDKRQSCMMEGFSQLVDDGSADSRPHKGHNKRPKTQ